MNLSQTDAEDATLKAIAEFEQWREGFEAAWAAPVRITAMRVMWQRLPAVAKAQLAVAYPEQFKIVDDWLR